MNVAIVIGTRPEAIKMAPCILELRKRMIRHTVIVTAQHREMLDQPLEAFTITPDYDLNIMIEHQDVFYVTTSILNALQPILLKEKPDILLVQGDTTTTFAASLAAFYLHIPVGHIEAGLRTWDKENPFPEEVNRQLTSRIAALHFAPTERAKQNLLNEGTNPDTVSVTGNTAIDALLIAANEEKEFKLPELDGIAFEDKKILLLTAHRRENFGEPLRSIFSACRTLVDRNPDVELVYPVHPNPDVHTPAYELLSNHQRIHLVHPLTYHSFVHLMKRCYLIMTDSGGIQEEAPSFGKPVFVLRKTTERPEAIEAGTAKLVGTDETVIVEEVQKLLSNPAEYNTMAKRSNPYGDGTAAEQIVNILLEHYS